jgi:hypothetical protein
LSHGSLPLALGFSEQMRRANFVVLHVCKLRGISKCAMTAQLGWHRYRSQMQ